MVTQRNNPQHLAPRRKNMVPLAAVIIAVLLCGGVGFAVAQGMLPGMKAPEPASASSSVAESNAADESPAASSADVATSQQQAQSEVPQSSSQQSSAEAAASEQVSSEQSSSEQASSSATASSAEEKSQSESTPANSELAWRDTDFAVDPARPAGSNADNGRKVVYITIDDGPSARTPEVLDILDKYNAKATFFVVGADPSNYHYIKEAYDRGHTIGLHTMTHDYAAVYASTDAYYADLNQIGQVVKDQIGYVPCFIRFPGGSSNGVSADYCAGIMSELVNSVQAQGYQYYDWNVSTGDGAVHTADELVGYVKEFEPETNIVLLCHDSETKQTTVEALPQIIEYYQGLGYSFEAIDRNTWVPHHGVAN